MAEWGDSLRWAREYFRDVRPTVVRGLAPLRARAEAIPHAELRSQALSSLNTKQFHCEGGGVFAAPSRDPDSLLMPFLLPYQTLCDYLDTVTDRGPSQDPADLRQLHQALIDAANPDGPYHDYYALHPYGNDGGYILSLVDDARQALLAFPGFPSVRRPFQRLVQLYVDLQVYKHGPEEARVPALTQWFRQEADPRDHLQWWEFAAATGSTLGLFALLNAAQQPHPSQALVDQITRLYFPWVGALHILLDYYVDQEEDRLGGDLNFVTYYRDPEAAVSGIRRIYRTILAEAAALPDGAFHQYVSKGLLGFYLSDQKTRRLPASPTCRLLVSGGSISFGIYLAALVGRSP